MKPPWQALQPLEAGDFEEVRLQTIFECCKWDPQVGDVTTLLDFSLLLEAEIWQTLAKLAEQLALETFAAEEEICQQPTLLQRLGIPRGIQKLWQHRAAQSAQAVRVIRFDFHYTTEGWRISEGNTDVPSGFIESSGFTSLMAGYYPRTQKAGNPADALASAILQTVGQGATIALVYATAYTDDHQVMAFLAKYLKQRGLQTHLISPVQLQWRQGNPWLIAEQIPIDFIYRFFPGEWLPNLPRSSNWQQFFRGLPISHCNPTTALISQSKRFPLVWDALKTPMNTWRALLPQTCDLREIRDLAKETWVIKPAFGRVGENIGIMGVTRDDRWQALQLSIKKHPHQWVVQRRFETLPTPTPRGYLYPCIGVYTVNERAVGIYGRASHKPLIDEHAWDIAVLLKSSGG